MKIRSLFVVFSILASLLIAGCGGDKAADSAKAEVHPAREVMEKFVTAMKTDTTGVQETMNEEVWKYFYADSVGNRRRALNNGFKWEERIVSEEIRDENTVAFRLESWLNGSFSTRFGLVVTKTSDGRWLISKYEAMK